MAAPRLVWVAALVGSVAAIPIAALGFIVGDLLDVAVIRVFGDNELTDLLSVATMIVGSLVFMAGVILGGGWIGSKIGRLLYLRRNGHRSN